MKSAGLKVSCVSYYAYDNTSDKIINVFSGLKMTSKEVQ